MKKTYLIVTVLVTMILFTFNSCKKDATDQEPQMDGTAPTLTLNGSSTVTIDLGTVYADLGATANDAKDGAITPTVSGSVDVNKVGTYTINYRAVDSDGNQSTASRTVKVKADKLSASYTVTETYEDATTYSYTQFVMTSNDYNKLVFQSFGDMMGGSVTATVTQTGFTCSEKTWVYQASSTCPFYIYRVYNITGTYEKNGLNYNIKTISYKIDATPQAGGTTTTSNVSQLYSRQ